MQDRCSLLFSCCFPRVIFITHCLDCHQRDGRLCSCCIEIRIFSFLVVQKYSSTREPISFLQDQPQTWVESARAFTAKQDSKTAYQQKSHEKGASEVGGIAVPYLPSVAILTIHASPRLPKRSPANSTVPRSNLCSAAFTVSVL